MPRLVIFDNQVRGIDLPGQPVIIGRSKKSDVPIHDHLLSRRHCAIVPSKSAYRLVDLKSANGTYLNGNRIHRRADLNYDDIIEIGKTVLVFLDTGVWNRGEALARLRNPIKAQELIQRLKMRQQPENPAGGASAAKPADIPVDVLPAAGKRGNRTRSLLALFRELPVMGGTSPGAQGELVDLLTDFALYKSMSFVVRHHPRLKRLLSQAVESSLVASLDGSWPDLRSRLRAEIERGLKNGGESPEDGEPGDPPAAHGGSEKTPGS